MASDLRERMKSKFREQIAFLESSCHAFDKGNESEAFRIATVLRVLLHDSSGNPRKPSVSLFAHLGLRSRLMLSSSRGHGNQSDFLSYAIDISGHVPARMVPILGNKFHEVLLKNWWRGEIILVNEGQNVTRAKLILDAANKDGGTHIDEKLPKYYAALKEGDQSIGIAISGLEIDGKPPFPEGVTQFATNSHLALVRQFAHEFQASVKHFDYIGDVRT